MDAAVFVAAQQHFTDPRSPSHPVHVRCIQPSRLRLLQPHQLNGLDLPLLRPAVVCGVQLLEHGHYRLLTHSLHLLVQRHALLARLLPVDSAAALLLSQLSDGVGALAGAHRRFDRAGRLEQVRLERAVLLNQRSLVSLVRRSGRCVTLRGYLVERRRRRVRHGHEQVAVFDALSHGCGEVEVRLVDAALHHHHALPLAEAAVPLPTRPSVAHHVTAGELHRRAQLGEVGGRTHLRQAAAATVIVRGDAQRAVLNDAQSVVQEVGMALALHLRVETVLL